MKSHPKFVFFTDFDGTITLQDSESQTFPAAALITPFLLFCDLQGWLPGEPFMGVRKLGPVKLAHVSLPLARLGSKVLQYAVAVRCWTNGLDLCVAGSSGHLHLEKMLHTLLHACPVPWAHF